MGSHKNVIEINGKLYDATSGILITQHTVRPAQSTKTIDGFVSASPKTRSTPSVAPKQVATAPQPKPVKNRTTNPNLKRRVPQKSQTLMRAAVKKPVAAKPTAEISTFSRQTAPNARQAKAQNIPKSAFINKFGTLSQHQPVIKRTEALAVKQAPQHTAPVHKQSAPARRAEQHAAPISKSEELFHKALQNATPAKPTTKRRNQKPKPTSRITKWGASIAAALLLIGFITYMNLPNINMQLASARAGFDASLPGYTPTGFKNGPVSHKAGQVTINFASNTDDRNYTVTQAVSSWNSEALQENFLNARNKNFQTAQESGKTIYMYDGGNATWVNGGVWYQVESNQALSSDQLLKIASSL